MDHGSPIPFPSERERAILAVREAVAAGRVHVIRRRRHRHVFARLRLAHDGMLDALRRLEAHHVRAGPMRDHHDGTRDVWVFGPVVEGIEMYVKVAIGRTEPAGAPHAVVWSFHPAQHPMTPAGDDSDVQ